MRFVEAGSDLLVNTDYVMSVSVISAPYSKDLNAKLIQWIMSDDTIISEEYTHQRWTYLQTKLTTG